MGIKDQVRELMSSISKIDNNEDREFQIEMLENLAVECADYISAVANMENSINVARFRLDGEDYRDLIVNLDKSRSRKHNVVISSVKVLNKLCFMHDLDKIYKGDVESRIEIAEFAKDYIDELWKERRL